MASRVLWFGIGFIAGSAYASRLISKERLDLPPGVEMRREAPAIKTRKRESPKLRIARLVDQKSAQLSEAICQRGHALATRLRGETTPAPGEDVLVPETAGAYPPYGSPTSAQAQMMATYGTGSEVGLEESR